ncbi:MAG: acyl-CoA dehydrogenase, partial [Planctomycetales bacterium]
MTKETPETFVETALKLGGKSDEEVQRTSALDRADDQVEALFAEKYQTAGSPIHRAVWDQHFPVDLFTSDVDSAEGRVAEVMERSLDVARRRREGGSL